MSITGRMFAVKHLEIHDGPGVRTTLFLKGCSLRCLWCHNPESVSPYPELAHYAHKCVNCGLCVSVCPSGAQIRENGAHRFEREKCLACGACAEICPEKANMLFGKEITAEQILPELLIDQPFFEETGGGVTVSGGEPLLQADFLCELLPLLKHKGIHVAIDTALAVPTAPLDKVLPYVDLFLCDIKAIDDPLHEKLTGQRFERVLTNLRYLRDKKIPVEIRVPFVPGFNDTQIPKIAALLPELSNVTKVKTLAYHDLARSKYEALGRTYPLPETLCPTSEQLAKAQAVLEKGVVQK